MSENSSGGDRNSLRSANNTFSDNSKFNSEATKIYFYKMLGIYFDKML